MKPVFCFGELLLRLSPLPSAEWIQKASMPVYIGGAECNVANALAAWQVPVQYCTALPKNGLADDICGVLSAKGIDVSHVLFSGSRIGIYYLGQGTDLKHAGVIYDRSHSSFSELEPNTIDWDELLKDAGWFHFSAISPALNKKTARVCKEALLSAQKNGLTISVDLNHRAKLWQYGKQPSEVMPELVSYCDVIMGNIWSANTLLGISLDEDIHERKSKKAYLQQANKTADEIMQRFPKCKTIAQTFRFDNDKGIRYYATLNHSNRPYISKEYCVDTIQDKVGSGDCFMAGIIYGLSTRQTLQYTVDFAAATAVGKMSETGDSTSQTIQAVEQIINCYE